MAPRVIVASWRRRLTGWGIRRLRWSIALSSGLLLLLGGPASGGSATALTTPVSPGFTVSVGYFDNEHGPNPPPADWGASTASITFLGGPLVPSTRGTYDSGGIRFDNSTAAPIKLDSVLVNIGIQHYNLWAPAQLIIPANGSLILANPGPTSQFDTSDYHCNGNPPKGPRDGIIPQIIVAQGGTPTSYADTTQVLTYDCTKPETSNWVPISGGGVVLPPPPVPSIASPADGSYNNTGSVTLSGTAQAGAQVRVYDGSALLSGSVVAGGSGNWTKVLAGVADGTHSYTATATDAAANTSAHSAATHVIVDTHAPTAPSIASPADGSYNNTGSVTLSGMAEAGAQVRVYDGSALLSGSVVAGGSGNWTKVLAGVADGTHSYTATATDAAANTSAHSAATHVIVDTHAPTAPSIASPADGSYNNTGSVTLSGTAEAGAQVKVYDGSALLSGSVVAGGSGNWTKVLAGVADGTHSYTATATDAAANTSAHSAATHVIVNTHAPITPITSLTSGPTGSTSHRSVSFTFVSSESGSTFQCRLLGPGTRSSGFSACSSPARFGRLVAGAYIFTVRATDSAGNTDPNPPSRQFTVRAGSAMTHAMTSLSLTPSEFRAASGGPSVTSSQGGGGTAVSFTLARPGRVRFTLDRRLPGPNRYGRCATGPFHHRGARGCVHYRRVTGGFVWIGVAGANHLHFTGRASGKALAPGRYRLLATLATGRIRSTAFRIMP